MRGWWLLGLVGCASGKLAVDRVDPPSAPNTAPVPIQIEGSGFHLAVTSSLDHTAATTAPMLVELGDLALDDATWQGEQLIAGTVPAGIAEGSYDVAVTIGGKRAVLVDGYTVANPVPMDAAIDAPHICLGTLDSTGHCFTFVAGPMNAALAAQACAADHAHLAKLENVEQNTIVYDLVQANTTTFTFIGLTDVVTENTFVWADGTPMVYNNFRPGEPNNSGSGTYEEDCVAMVSGGAGQWDDKNCDVEAADPDPGVFPFVCEFP